MNLRVLVPLWQKEKSVTKSLRNKKHKRYKKMQNHRILVFIFLMGFLVIFGCTRKKISYDENGQVKSELTYKGDMLHGKAI